MPIVENHSPGQKDINVNLGTAEKPILKSVIVPRGNGEVGPTKVVGEAEVSDEILAAIAEEPWWKAQLESGNLKVRTKKSEAADHRAAQADQSTHDKGSKR